MEKRRKPNLPRREINWNTGERVHKPSKGKGSYTRRPRTGPARPSREADTED